MHKTSTIKVSLVLVVLALVTGGSLVFCAVQSGEIISETDDWIFISKFCFSVGEGNLTWRGWSSDPTNLTLLIYNDAGSWEASYPYRNSLSCEQLTANAHGVRPVVPGAIHIQPFRQDTRPYYWFIVIANCGGTKLDFQYEFEFVNPGSSWIRQFSHDQQGLTGMYLTFWIIFSIGCLIHFGGVWTLMRNKSYHPIVRLLTCTLLLQTFSLLFSFIHYSIFGSNGIGAPGLLGLGDILDMASQLSFMFLLILLATGWSITRNEIRYKGILLAILGVFLLLYVSMFIWQNVGLDPASTTYVYETVPGIIILCLRVLTMAWFLFCLRGSYLDESHPNKRRFYFVFGSIYTVWFLLLPLIVIIASVDTADWNKYRLVQGMYLTLNALGFGIMIFLFWPTKAAEYFQMTKTDTLLSPAVSSYETL